MHNELTNLFTKYNSDKGTIGYGPYYYHHFLPMKDAPITVMELGIMYGASLRAWRDFFPNAEIVGVDNSYLPDNLPDRITIHAGHQEDANFINSLIVKYQGFDIIIDDCGHYWKPQQTSYELLWPHIKAGGYYVIEDLGTSFRPEFSGDHNITTVDYLLKIASGVVGDEFRRGEIESVHFYSNQAFIKKKS